MRWWPRAYPVSAAARALINAQLAADEVVLRWAALSGGGAVAVSRFALRAADSGGKTRRWGWAELAKVGLQSATLMVVTTTPVSVWSDGTVLVRDAAPESLTLARPDRLTDLVHARVRRSVAASARLELSAGGAWLALRRVPGVDGLQRQLRLDPGTAADSDQLPAAVAEIIGRLEQQARAPEPRAPRPRRPGHVPPSSSGRRASDRSSS